MGNREKGALGGCHEISRAGDIVEAKLDGGKMAYLKLKREPGADGKGVVLKNVKYFDASTNEGFEMCKSIEHRADLGGQSSPTRTAMLS